MNEENILKLNLDNVYTTTKLEDQGDSKERVF